ncbi:MAG: glycosyltransferase family 4 protein [Candidatus Bathyarchaeia archaeon]
MKLLFVAPSYYPRIGGVEYVAKSVAERLVRRKHGVTVLCGDSSLKDPREEWVNGVLVVRWPVWSPGDAYHIPRLRKRLEGWLHEASKGCDVAHFHSVHSVLTIYSLKTLKDYGIRRVLTPYYHGTGHTAFRRALWKGWRSYLKGIMPHADAVHTVSKLEAELIEKDFKAKALSIENGVDEWILNLPWLPSGYAMYSGRIEAYKNVHRLAKIVRILNARFGMDLELRVFGSGPYLSPLKRRLEGMGLKCLIGPPQPFEDYIRKVSRASFFGLISEKESYPQSINEANAIGVPVIVAEPWGLNFRGRRRTLITKLNKSDEAIAQEIYAFLEEAVKQPKSEVPSWDRVVELYLKVLYGS